MAQSSDAFTLVPSVATLCYWFAAPRTLSVLWIDVNIFSGIKVNPSSIVMTRDGLVLKIGGCEKRNG
jgi:hypothetical protein